MRIDVGGETSIVSSSEYAVETLHIYFVYAMTVPWLLETSITPGLDAELSLRSSKSASSLSAQERRFFQPFNLEEPLFFPEFLKPSALGGIVTLFKKLKILKLSMSLG